MNEELPTYTAFLGDTCLASGPLETVLPPVKTRFDQPERHLMLLFHDQTGEQVDFQMHGSLSAVLERAIPAPHRAGPGRPKLGVVSREISLLPRHWSWLEEQSSGASAALRRLIDEARKREPNKQRARRSMNVASRVLTAMGGNLPGYEEATRALFAGQRERFEAQIRDWPGDVKAYVQRLASDAFQG